MWDESSQSLQGKLLIAACHLRDPNFYKTVVLVVEHGEGGAMGLVVNRPTSISVARALSEHFELPDRGELVYYGGPVEPNALFVIHNAEDIDNGSPIIPGLYVGSSAEAFENVVRSAADDNDRLRFRIYSGCAGWAPRQLEAELDQGDWFVLPATADIVFADDPYAVYDALLRDIRRAQRIIPTAVEDPELN
ncbi:MAG: YqgE/AlgH family protein [Planctomycetota bacterium]|nr:MAG: YqgE/AlgH family protein [Planctomycetota bacterium]